MKLLMASDIHGSALYCRHLLDAADREQPDRILLLGDLLDEKNDAMAAVGRLRPAARYALYVVFLLGILLLIPKTTAAPFIYFQF